jgi:hypothetical protein
MLKADVHFACNLERNSKLTGSSFENISFSDALNYSVCLCIFGVGFKSTAVLIDRKTRNLIALL